MWNRSSEPLQEPAYLPGISPDRKGKKGEDNDHEYDMERGCAKGRGEILLTILAHASSAEVADTELRSVRLFTHAESTIGVVENNVHDENWNALSWSDSWDHSS